MKAPLQYTVVLLLALAHVISAFTPPGRIHSGTIHGSYSVATSSNIKYNRSIVKIDMKRNKPAKSQEEDVELTRAIIMKHIESTEDTTIDDDDSDVVATSSTGSTEGKKPLKKIKSIGKKIKNKVKKKLEKEG